MNPYLEALELVKQHWGTSGQTALAKCILSLYNPNNAFSMGEILAPLDERYTRVVLNIAQEYAKVGETEDLRVAGRWVAEEFPQFIDMAMAMSEARHKLRNKWEREREEENRRLYPHG
jgi:hypothetical protein